MNTIQKHPMELTKGNVLASHPGTGEDGRWTVIAPPVRCEETAELELAGPEGIVVCAVSVHTEVTVHITEQQATIAGLRALADFLEANPQVPAHLATTLQYSASTGRTHEESVAEVDRVAALLGVEAGYPYEGAHYQADRHFGPVVYHAVAVKREPKPAEQADAKAEVSA